MNSRHICISLLSSFAFVLSCSQPETTDYSKKVTTKTSTGKGTQSSSNSSGATPEGDDQGTTIPGNDEDDTKEDSSGITPSTGTGTGSIGTGTGTGTGNTGTGTGAGTTTPDPSLATGNLTVSVNYVKPSTNGTHYTRGHVRAVWITTQKNGKDVYVRTLESFGVVRSVNLKRWAYFIDNYYIDGVTQATKAYVAGGLKDPLANLTWDLKDTDGKVAALGKYKVWFELSTGNTKDIDTSKLDQEQNIGNGYAFYSVPFELTAAASTVQDSKSPVFTNIKVIHAIK